MRRPFERLVRIIDNLSQEEMALTLGELGRRLDETPQRLMDAFDASRMLKGELTFLSLDDEFGGES